MSNCPRLSPELQNLFPAGAVVAEMHGRGDAATLLPAEAEHLGRAVPKRVAEFAAGRACARRALAEFAIGDFPVRAAGDRQPIWPDSVVGSITHTDGFCAAVVAARPVFRGIGIDAEVVGQVSREIWGDICTAAEAAWVQSLPESKQHAAITSIFSVKEAFYKCQYPLVGEWLDFHDLSIAGASGVGPSPEIAVHATRPLAIAKFTRFPVTARRVFHDGLITVGVAIVV